MQSLAERLVSAFLNLKQKTGAPSDQIIEEIAVEFGKDPSVVRKVVVRFSILRKQRPSKLHDLDENCFILLEGRQIRSCRELTKGQPREHKPWLAIERSCLLCSMYNHKGKDSVKEVSNDLAAYFDRSPEAIAQEFYRLTKKKK